MITYRRAGTTGSEKTIMTETTVTEPEIAAPAPEPARRLSLLTPTGALTLGNYLGALRPIRDSAGEGFFGISNLQAMTVEHDPATLRARTDELAMIMVAAGVDPDRNSLFRQSEVPAHLGLQYLLECTATMGEFGRMIQYKDKGRGRPETRVSLFTYPALMAADILLYRAAEVPVGDDQRQHVEITRDLAIRFNRRYGEVFVVPKVINPPVAARVMNLQHPTEKMGKSNDAVSGVLFLLDPPDVITRKIKRAVTDAEREVSYDPERRPGVSNLIEIAAGCRNCTIETVINDHADLGSLKQGVIDAVLAELEPLRRAYRSLDRADVDAIFAAGAERARAVTEPVLAAARQAIGL
ncbi:tryptophan--tRNA ligase [Microlunatus parietis]|uniref:Tryptophan--tRNA ligase n=1 Tax=Microlunatus parietis TaxID=682979 RepID=A0A7Y9I4Z5_9ACTN|nr:tryptophan--tRNA ligase [Microlunatus parietis]NYE69889.1 tryptophanyl-tRNA synthetase [Microlunatus parietis]